MREHQKYIRSVGSRGDADAPGWMWRDLHGAPQYCEAIPPSPQSEDTCPLHQKISLEGKLQIRQFARFAQNYAVPVSDFVPKKLRAR